MRQPTCPKCHSTHTRAISALFGADLHTLIKSIYIVLQCDGRGEIFMRKLEGAE
jgi:hypothetical protein